jgi:hypothetical protein
MKQSKTDEGQQMLTTWPGLPYRYHLPLLPLGPRAGAEKDWGVIRGTCQASSSAVCVEEGGMGPKLVAGITHRKPHVVKYPPIYA